MDARTLTWCYNGRDVTIPVVPEEVQEFCPPDPSIEVIEEAMDILERLAADPKFAHAGQRNDDGVNLGIALYVLGCRDFDEWLRAIDTYLDMDEIDYDELSIKLDTVEGYIPSWSKSGTDVKGTLDYTIR